MDNCIAGPKTTAAAPAAAFNDKLCCVVWGRPDDLSGVVLLLASSASDYIHGAVIPVDGGWLGR